MNKYVKCGVGLGALIVGLILVNAAQAAVSVSTPFSTTLDPLTGWPAYNAPGILYDGVSDGIQQQDKIWKYVSKLNFPTTEPLTFNLFTNAGVDHHSLTIGNASNVLTLGTYELDYSITVDPASALSGRRITAASIGVDKDGSTGIWSVTKSFFDDLGNPIGIFTVNNTQPVLAVDPFLFATGQTSIHVHEVWDVQNGSTIVSTTNTFVQTVPEPASIAIWALLGGVGLVVGLRRRKSV